MQIEHDKVSGQNTTGHEWDGIKELDTPIPRVVTWSYRLTILFAVGYWVFYPAWPYITDFTRGLTGYSSRVNVMNILEASDLEHKATNAALFSQPIDELAKNAEIRDQYEAGAAVLFADNCSACHGQNLTGQTKFPSLKDEAWLWSDLPEEIEATILYGINSGHDEERFAEMSAFGADEILEKDEISQLISYVQSISNQTHDEILVASGAELFEENCSGCHGDGGEGGLEVGAPNLTDDFWIYGSDAQTLSDTIWYGRKGVMPSWENRLSKAEIRKLALYVYWQSHDPEK